MAIATFSLGSSTFTGLEATGESRILLEIFLVFGPGRGGDRAQLAARERRLQQIGRIVLARRAAGADQRVGLVDEQDDRLGTGLGLLDHRLEAILEFALHAGAGLQQAEIERAQGDVAQRRRHIARRDAQRQAFDDGGLADARFAGEDRVVLPAARQDVDHLPDFGVTPEDRVDLAGLGLRREIDRELIEGRGSARPRLARPGAGRFGADGLAGRLRCLGRVGADRLVLALERVRRDLRELGRDLAGMARQHFVGDQRPQQMARAHAIRALFDGGQQPALLYHLDDIGRERRRARVAGLHPVERAIDVRQQACRLDVPLAQDRGEVAVGAIEQADQQMFDLDVVMGTQSRSASRRFEGAAADIVQTSDQWFQLYRAHLFLVSSKDISPGEAAAHRLSCTLHRLDKRIFS